MRRAIQRLIQDPLALQADQRRVRAKATRSWWMSATQGSELQFTQAGAGGGVSMSGTRGASTADYALPAISAPGLIPDDLTNTLKTALLLGLLSALLLIGGQAIGGPQRALHRPGLAVVMNFASYFFSDKIALSMYAAQPVTRDRKPGGLPPRRAHRARPRPAHGAAHAEAVRHSRAIRPTPSPPAATRRTPRWPSPPASCS